MDSKILIDCLKEFGALRDGDGLKSKSTDRIEPVFSEDGLSDLPESLKKSVDSLGIQSLYEHQSEAIKQSVEGKNVVLEAPTASGKTLSFLIPMLSRLIKNENERALLIYPMKALANDQRRQMNDLRVKENLGIDSWTLDGDTEKEHRELFKKCPPHILITNPDSLHASFLGWSEQWHKFLENLKFIVIDEIHEYRGFFGTNVGLLIRRFLLYLNQKGIDPQLFLLTATCANPKEHAQRLTNRDFSLVKSTNGFAPARHFVFVTPKIPDYQYIDIFRLRIANAALACLSKDLSTIVFCPSRKFTEDINRTAKKEAEKKGLDTAVFAPYRSGYRAEDRRDIEQGLRDGRYKVVFSTNALELGIDIGKLDCVILAGFPDNIMSAWQRIGRAGRGWDKDAYILFYALNNAVDRFYASNIDQFVNKPLDEIVVGIDNEELIEKHLPYLLHETKREIKDEHEKIIGKQFYEMAKEKAGESKPVVGGRGPSYLHLGIRGNSGATNKLKHEKQEVGSISEVYKFREAYIGAMYNHLGKTYKVVGHGDKEVNLESAEPYLESQPNFYTAVTEDETIKGEKYGESIGIFYGKITTIENFAGYKLVDTRSDAVLDEQKNNSARTKKAHAFWIRIIEEGKKDTNSGIKALENIMRVGAIFTIPADRHDTSTISRPKDRDIYVYENYEGGIGIAEKLYQAYRDAIERGILIAKECKCKKGCPLCIYPPKLKDTADIEKESGLELANWILDKTKKSAEEVFDSTTYGWKRKR